ncbi:gamma-glutamyl-gamma-aminobutyrate hydrolase family protein [Levilactobacillus tangyuanensis]|uniref:Gamma-glutamyl-gamma-aminobutyrate hydrolase family protein n=1 Tax=Levilactobacillus tangyuanensis TaxID=2486021 RepID=A0ABW1TNP1_9LACO|nr:gamma-glutamyl-gamma-aminobutyrate hydrolase family protein [Levilactobacillus tangyuanensis]
MRQRIALPADTLGEATNIINERNAAFAPRPVVEAIVAAGGIPVILPTVDPDLVPDYLSLFDGVAFLGGADVDPTFYQEEPHVLLGKTDRKRDLFEMALLHAAIDNNKAVLGICRGLQLINVTLGGTLYQDLTEDPNAKIKHSQAAFGNQVTHHATVTPGSHLAEITGKRLLVNSRHHQAAKTIAPDLTVTARADDQVVEAVESTASDQVLAVQWHPENLFKHDQTAMGIFTNLIKRAADRA